MRARRTLHLLPIPVARQVDALSCVVPFGSKHGQTETGLKRADPQ
jgi:hypothetical protein